MRVIPDPEGKMVKMRKKPVLNQVKCLHQTGHEGNHRQGSHGREKKVNTDAQGYGSKKK